MVPVSPASVCDTILGAPVVLDVNISHSLTLRVGHRDRRVSNPAKPSPAEDLAMASRHPAQAATSMPARAMTSGRCSSFRSGGAITSPGRDTIQDAITAPTGYGGHTAVGGSGTGPPGQPGQLCMLGFRPSRDCSSAHKTHDLVCDGDRDSKGSTPAKFSLPRCSAATGMPSLTAQIDGRILSSVARHLFELVSKITRTKKLKPRKIRAHNITIRYGEGAMFEFVCHKAGPSSS